MKWVYHQQLGFQQLWNVTKTKTLFKPSGTTVNPCTIIITHSRIPTNTYQPKQNQKTTLYILGMQRFAPLKMNESWRVDIFRKYNVNSSLNKKHFWSIHTKVNRRSYKNVRKWNSGNGFSRFSPSTQIF